MRAILGPFEQAVLQAVIRQSGDGYGVTIRREVTEITGREIAIGAIYTTLARMETKGLVSSRVGEATPERGGRAKRYFRVEASGVRAMSQARQHAIGLWEMATAGAPL